ncbi:MAG: YraN family protein [Patescibacteria group bacterium]
MHNRQKGNKGEDIACSFLSKKGFIVMDRNYSKKWGELDIVAQKDGKLHFFEVKSVLFGEMKEGNHRPEDNVHGLKVRSIRRMIETYMDEKRMVPETEFYFHVLCVFMDVQRRSARVKWIENIIL